jgi:DNA polymerase-1
MQGTAADLIKLAMLAVQQAIDAQRRATRIVMQVHDELVFEVPLAEVEVMEAMVKLEMESVMPLRVPLVADVGAGENWLDAKS